MPKLTPTGGLTYCTVETGGFVKTYNGSTMDGCCFKRDQSCLSQWTWNSPVKVTKFRVYSQYYDSQSYIYKIWGLVGSDWVEIWSGTWHPSNNAWASKSISCDNCTGIRIAQMHLPQNWRPCILEVEVEYEEIPPEGKAEIIDIDAPSEFTPGVQFTINTTVKNIGGSDTIFLRLRNKDTGEILEERSVTIGGNGTRIFTYNITLYQETDFHGRLEAGHEE